MTAGISNNFRYIDSKMMIRHDIEQAMESTVLVFTAFSALMSIIALFISFFLLLISMTQNVTEALWEYGVLRSMGVTESEGNRLY